MLSVCLLQYWRGQLVKAKAIQRTTMVQKFSILQINIWTVMYSKRVAHVSPPRLFYFTCVVDLKHEQDSACRLHSHHFWFSKVHLSEEKSISAVVSPKKQLVYNACLYCIKRLRTVWRWRFRPPRWKEMHGKMRNPLKDESGLVFMRNITIMNPSAFKGRANLKCLYPQGKRNKKCKL